jgi:hypothetical protein
MLLDMAGTCSLKNFFIVGKHRKQTVRYNSIDYLRLVDAVPPRQSSIDWHTFQYTNHRKDSVTTFNPDTLILSYSKNNQEGNDYLMTQLHGVILDIDGTLVDSNDANARAWIEAMAEQGHTVSFERVRPLIGMGGDKVLPEILDISKDSDEGKKISQRRKQIMIERYQPTLRAFPKSRELLERMHEQGLKLVVATSAEQDELQGLLHIIGPNVPDLFQQETTSQDAPKSKPNPEVMDPPQGVKWESGPQRPDARRRSAPR